MKPEPRVIAKQLAIRVFRKLGVLKHMNFTMHLSKAGQKFEIPLISGIGSEFFFDEKENWMTVFLQRVKETARNGSFVDVGANIGQTLLKVKAIDRNWRYIGFEPNPNCLRYLYELADLNSFRNVQLIPFGLSDKFSLTNLYLYTRSYVDATASVVTGFRSNAVKAIPVPVVSGEEIFKGLDDRVSILKIDVEGNEYEVVKGLFSIIKRDQPLIICEVLPVYENESARLQRQLNLEKVLHALEYRKFRIHLNGTLEYRANIGIHDNLDHSNYLFCPASWESSVPTYFTVIR